MHGKFPLMTALLMQPFPYAIKNKRGEINQLYGNFVPMTMESGPLSTPLSHDDHSQVVKPIVETDISRAASSFAKDSTLIKYR